MLGPPRASYAMRRPALPVRVTNGCTELNELPSGEASRSRRFVAILESAHTSRMSAVTYDIPEELEVPSDSQFRITVDRYHQMGKAGVFQEDEHVELLVGVLVAKEPQGGGHGSMIQFLTGLLVRGVGEAYDVRVQLALALGPLSEPEPDFAVVPVRPRGAPREHPATAALVVEVARTSLRIDRGVKAQLYARAGIPEYWIINLRDSVVEVHRQPDSERGRYRERQVLQGDAVLAPCDLPGPEITVNELFAWG